MGTKSRETIYGASIRAAAERAAEARKEADRLACEAWNKRMLGFQGPAQPSPTLGDAINAGFGYLEVKCLGCDTHQTVALDIVRRPKTTPVHELERYMRCKNCSEVRRTSAAIWWPAAGVRYLPMPRPLHGGRASDELDFLERNSGRTPPLFKKRRGIMRKVVELLDDEQREALLELADLSTAVFSSGLVVALMKGIVGLFA